MTSIITAKLVFSTYFDENNEFLGQKVIKIKWLNFLKFFENFRKFSGS